MLKKITENVEIHQTLPDIPNLTSEELKKEWDKGSRIIKQAFNELIDELNNVKVSELKEMLQRNIITAYPTSSLTDITQSQQKVNLDGYDSIGEKITVENNAIKIGKGISKILISAQIFYQDGPTGNGYYFPDIKINDKIVARSIVPTSVSGGSAFITAYINEFLIDVKEGDLITLSTGDSPLGFTNLKYRGTQYIDEIKTRHTYITVEAIA